jgi:hypothetical protein
LKKEIDKLCFKKSYLICIFKVFYENNVLSYAFMSIGAKGGYLVVNYRT